jgi:mono/diheme cytochrome c family protein
LRVVETPEKRFWTKPQWDGQGSVSPAIGWDEFMVKKILGTVPVNDDGSAYFEVPAEKFVYFQLLDKDGVMLQTMRSGTMVQPGESNGCVGCHDDRLAAVSGKTNFASVFKNKPAKLQPWQGKPAKEFSYREEVQPIWDKNCVSCHTPEKRAGKKLNLTGGSGQVFNPSYSELWAKRYIRPVGAGPARILQAHSWGAGKSKLLSVLSKKHGGVLLDKSDLEKIVTWVDINAPYYPSYATSYPDNPYGRSPLTFAETRRLEKLTGQSILPRARNRERLYIDSPEGKPEARDIALIRIATVLNFDAPEKSPALDGLKEKDAGRYAEALKIIQTGKERIRENGSNDTAGFTLCPIDAWREEKYQSRLLREQANRQSIVDGKKSYDAPARP